MSYDKFISEHSYNPKINTSMIEDNGFFDSILIEGDKETLNFLADLIKELANDDGQMKAAISPDGAGCAYFLKGSKIGIYLNKIK